MSGSNILTKSGLNRWNILIIICSVGMIATSFYLMAHYFQTFFPKGLGGDLCNINGFFSCDAVAYSALSSIFSVPISLFGVLAGAFLIFSAIFPSSNLEGTNRLFAILNGAGCLLLFIYSIAFTGHLCPACTLYYIFSWLVVFAFIKGGSIKTVSIKVIVVYGVITIICAGIMNLVVSNKQKEQEQLAKVYAAQFASYPNLGRPAVDSDYRNYSSTKKFRDAPIQITIFSDFQCPACGKLAKILSRVEARYQGKMNIQFFFYPLDQECNPSMYRSMHPEACTASYLAACLPGKFSEIHDLIFENQRILDDIWLNNLAKKHGVYDCMNDRKTKEKVISMVRQGDAFNIRSTPTMIINGVKIEGVLPLVQIYAILDQLVVK